MKFSAIFLYSLVSLNYSPFLNAKEANVSQQIDYRNTVQHSTSKGFGFIRDINPETKTVSVITPLTSAELSLVNVVVKSSLVQFTKDLFMEDSILNVESWVNLPSYNEERKGNTACTTPFAQKLGSPKNIY